MPKISQHNQKHICPICDETNYKKVFSSSDADRISQTAFELIRCKTCGLVSTTPFLSDQEMAPWYRSGYHGWWEDNGTPYKGACPLVPRSGRRVGGRSEWISPVAGDALLRYLFDMLSRLFQLNRSRRITKYKPEGRLADIGCGDGTFLAFMLKRGWDVLGLEDLNRYKHAAETGAGEIRIIQHDTDRWYESFAPFDVITLWHVLEHVEKPVKTLRQACNALKPGGIVVLSIPNIKSLQAAMCKDRWFHLDVPRHRWHFTPETISLLLRKSGFSRTTLSHFSLEYNPFGWWQSILNLSRCTHNFAYNLLKRRESPDYKNKCKGIYDAICSTVLGALLVPVALILAAAEALAGRGGTITVVARKKRKEI